MSTAISETDRARFLALCAAGRYAEAESMLLLLFPDGSALHGDEVISRGAFYEDWADSVADDDPAAASTAYAQAEELFATFAAVAAVRGQGAAAPVDVARVRSKRQRLP